MSAPNVPALEEGWRAFMRNERRERIATAVLSGFAACDNAGSWGSADAAFHAVIWADALMKELEKPL